MKVSEITLPIVDGPGCFTIFPTEAMAQDVCDRLVDPCAEHHVVERADGKFLVAAFEDGECYFVPAQFAA